MVKNKVQELRMKGYFVDAATEIIRGEGLVCVSARNVAERAGYSYATLYNYFKDIQELILECVRGFCVECGEFVENESESDLRGVPRIKLIAKAYAKYFLQYPGIFQLFFIEGVSEIKNQSRPIHLINSLFFDLTAEEWKFMITSKEMSQEDADMIMNQLRFGLTGMLLLFLNRHSPASFSEFVSQLDKYLEDVFLRIVN